MAAKRTTAKKTATKKTATKKTATKKTATKKTTTQKKSAEPVEKASHTRDGAKPPRHLPKGETLEERKERFQKIYKLLHKAYPDAKCALDFYDPYSLLVATILSAQCTDKRVNMVTPEFHRRYPTPEDVAAAPIGELEEVIRTTGFFRQKAKSLQSVASDLVEKYEGKVPDTMEDLTSLRGVGRKTANVVLGNAFGKSEGIAVDTHVTRLSGRLGLSAHEEQEKIEADLMELAKRSQWTIGSHLLILHGRNICIARKPKCSQCLVSELCPSAFFPGSE